MQDPQREAVKHRAAGAEQREAGGSARAVLVSCTGDSEMAGFEAAARAQGADGVWTKPFPNFANGELQGSLLALLRAAGKC